MPLGTSSTNQAYLVIPVRFELNITNLRGWRPGRLDEGTMSALIPELMLFYALTRRTFS